MFDTKIYLTEKNPSVRFVSCACDIKNDRIHITRSCVMCIYGLFSLRE